MNDYDNPPASPPGLIIESLTNYDSGGGDENVTLKENSRCLTLERSYSISCNLSKLIAANLPG